MGAFHKKSSEGSVPDTSQLPAMPDYRTGKAGYHSGCKVLLTAERTEAGRRDKLRATGQFLSGCA